MRPRILFLMFETTRALWPSASLVVHYARFARSFDPKKGSAEMVKAAYCKAKNAIHGPAKERKLEGFGVSKRGQVWRQIGENLKLPVHLNDFRKREAQAFQKFYEPDRTVSAEARRLFEHLRVAKSTPDKVDWPWNKTFVVAASSPRAGLISANLERQGITIGHCLTNGRNLGNEHWQSSAIYDIDLLIQRDDFGVPFKFPDVERDITSLVQPNGTLRDKGSDHTFLYLGSRRIFAASQDGWHPIYLNTRVPPRQQAHWKPVFKCIPPISSRIRYTIDTIRKVDDVIHWRPRPAQAKGLRQLKRK